MLFGGNKNYKKRGWMESNCGIVEIRLVPDSEEGIKFKQTLTKKCYIYIKFHVKIQVKKLIICTWIVFNWLIHHIMCQ